MLIHRATGIVNFAQGEMGMFCTYIAWSLIYHHGLPYWRAFFLTLVIAFVGGAAIYKVVIRPLSRTGRADGRDGDDRAAGDPERRWPAGSGRREVKFLESPFPLERRLTIGGVVDERRRTSA